MPQLLQKIGEKMQQQQQPSAKGLPPTGMQQQNASLNQALQQSMPGQPAQPGMTRQMGQGSLGQLANRLAQQYGLPIGQGGLVDAAGNFLMTPEQIAKTSGGTVTEGGAAASMNLIAEAMQKQQQEQQMYKSQAALQTGVGLVQSRARGSLAAMQSGFYQNLAELYQQQQYEAADFSYWIQREQAQKQEDLMRRAEKLAKKQARGAFGGSLLQGIAGGLMTAFGIPGGTGLLASGIGGMGQSAGGTGWF
jgi:hypothetical protein